MTNNNHSTLSLSLKSWLNLEPVYKPDVLARIYYQRWLDSSLFDPPEHGEPYAIVFPPPNVTGKLHIGHALNFTLQDIYNRYKRMRGFRVLWIPGLDHAGIATQLMVEKSLLAEGTTRQELGREEFIKRVWLWKDQYTDDITNQAKALSIGCAWNRLRFTLDEGLNRAVVRSFVSLHREGLVYRDHRLVNWDIRLQTAVSDLEVLHEERVSRLYTIRYPLVDSDEYISVATVRPETLFGDEAVAVHPDDDRFKHLVGKQCRIPLTNKHIHIIADEMVKQDFGSGIVKITPAHDFNDFQVARRHKLPVSSVMDLQGRLNERVPKKWQGKDRLEARNSIVQALKDKGYLVDDSEYRTTVPVGERSGVDIEPTLTKQWFVDAGKLAGPVLKIIDEGKTKFYPENWRDVFCDWLQRIEPWCVSRQLWWGHRIPAWYGKGQIFVAENEFEAQKMADEAFGSPVALTQDDDVLDTWFSSALWPYSVIGWPDDQPRVIEEVKSFYPASLLITGHDILFFWVARMMMMGVFTHGKQAFNEVYINALVKDVQGRKMSKTKGNAIDPMLSIKLYGADSLRYALVIQSSPGRDIRMDDARIEGMRAFTTKIWNALRFYKIHAQQELALSAIFIPKQWKCAESLWILGKWNQCLVDVSKSIDSYRPDRAAQTLYHFIWSIYCDWYIELIKPDLQKGHDDDFRKEHLACARLVIDGFLRTLHPFMPVLSEHLWNASMLQTTNDAEPDPQFLLTVGWPDPIEIKPMSGESENDDDIIERAISLIGELRSIRSLFEAKTAYLSLSLIGKGNEDQQWITTYGDRIGRLSSIPITDPEIDLSVTRNDLTTIDITSGSIICRLQVTREALTAVQGRLVKRSNEMQSRHRTSKAKLDNPKFRELAPAEVVAEKEKVHAILTAALEDIANQQNRLRGTTS